MGRTVKPFSLVLSEQQAVWSKFKKHLELRDRAALDFMFESARLHNHAAVYASFTEPIWPEMLSILLERQKRVSDIGRRVERLDKKVKELLDERITRF